MQNFDKPTLSVAQQISRLQERGLEISDTSAATRFLSDVGYYRLSGYMLPFQIGGGGTNRHTFHPGTHFGNIVRLYTFDRKLRLLILDSIERVEISLRAVLSEVLATEHGPHWFMESTLFDPARFDHIDFIARLKTEIGHDQPKRRDIFIEHYYSTYSTPEMPPSWMTFEAVSFGKVSMCIKGLQSAERKKVARALWLPEPAMRSWPHCFSYVRNACAHHSRIWNRTFTFKPFVLNTYRADLEQNDRLYAILSALQVLMRRISPDSHWPERIADLLREYPEMTPERLSFPPDWRERQLWN